MVKRQFLGFALRILASSLGIWLCVSWLSKIAPSVPAHCTGEDCVVIPNPLASSQGWIYFMVAGLFFSLLNAVVKPLIKTFALPLAILTMGISTVIINTAMVALTIRLLPGVEMDFWAMALMSIVMSLLNSAITYFVI